MSKWILREAHATNARAPVNSDPAHEKRDDEDNQDNAEETDAAMTEAGHRSDLMSATIPK
jgi:hypothetical protein